MEGLPRRHLHLVGRSKWVRVSAKANIFKVERRRRTAAKVLVVVVSHRIHSAAVTFVGPFSRRSAYSCLCPEAHVALSAFHISELYVPATHSELCV